MGVSANNDWREVDQARAEALAGVFGSDGTLFYARHPFAFGGNADVLGFFTHLPGAVYVTAELTGYPESCYADYELMICQRTASDWAPHVISRLAPYSQQAYIAAGETMDIDEATPKDSLIKALLFDTYATFELYGRQYELRLCLGITKAELQFKMEHGPQRLMELLRREGVYPYTDLKRESIRLGSI